MLRIVNFSILIFCTTLLLIDCNNRSSSPYLNITDTTASYVGKEVCRSCHWQVYETYMQTGMGKSWHYATKENSAADFSPHKSVVYDSILDLYYKATWHNDTMYIVEYRLKGKDTTHKRAESVQYIVGSGQHTNSHLIMRNGYLFQAPITYYTQQGKWDLAPGFENGLNSRFDRKIETECITCHNAYPKAVEGSMNKYEQVLTGIDCERCHGPGSIHVAQKQLGNIVDTSQGADYTIVNPRRLSIEQQNNLCQRCHLQGVAVLQESKNFFDFKPSQILNKTMDVFLPSYTHSDNNMLMASHVERMKMSQCYIVSGNMSCITCHNPHISVKNTPVSQFNTACKNCHEEKKQCTENIAIRNSNNDNCTHCHMPKNKSIDIPHVAVTDHLIKKKIETTQEKSIAQFIEMKCFNNDNVTKLNRAVAFMEFYERYVPKKMFLDSAIFYIYKSDIDTNKSPNKELIRYFYLNKKYNKITQIVDNEKDIKINDAWTFYRIGEAYTVQDSFEKANKFFKEAVRLKPLALDFVNKLATSFLNLQQLDSATFYFQKVIKEYPQNAEANTGLGYIYMVKNDWEKAMVYTKKAVTLRPDHVQSIVNICVIYYNMGKKALIKPLLLHALRLEPQNKQLVAMKQELAL